MSYKTILVHVDESSRYHLRIRLAAEIAKTQGAHLTGVAVTGVSRYIYQDKNFSAGDPNLAAHMKALHERAERAVASFDKIAHELGVPSCESLVANDEAEGGIVLLARYSDLIVVGQTSRDEPSPSVLPDFPEYVVLHAGRPVLIIPYAGSFATIGRRAVIAWDASREATRAVNDALPLLQQAEQVHIAVFNPPSGRPDADQQAGPQLARFLARQGVQAEVSMHKTSNDIGNALLSLAHDLDSDLIVMGAYGHSRFREMIMGGVSHTILGSMTVPVLMSH